MTANRLITRLSDEDRAEIASVLVRRKLKSGAGIAEPTTDPYIYFPETALVSFYCGEVDMGPIGLEGAVGIPSLFGVNKFRFAVIQERSALQLPASAARAAIEANRPLGNVLFSYYVFLLPELAEVARANALLSLEQRVARYLSLCVRRLGRSDLTLTHSVVAAALATRRPGVTDALHRLESKGLIRNTRGRILVRDVSALEHTIQRKQMASATRSHRQPKHLSTSVRRALG